MVGTNRQGEVKNNMGNREAKELICTTHGHELRGVGNAGRWRGATGQRGIKRKKNGTTVIAIYYNCNIINKIY